MIRTPVRTLAALLLGIALAAPANAQTRPNFLVIVADDMGFSDMGAYGGEIHTPNLDRLAQQGTRFTEFYVGSTCSPTRSMLLTGIDNHRTGLGNMYERTAPNQLGRIGYEGILSTQVPTVADRLKARGYRTYMAGKWHLGHSPAHVPHARGFDRSFTMLAGGGSHFDRTGSNLQNAVLEFNEDGRYIKKLPKDYYSTRSFTDKMIGYIEEGRDSDQPFMAYLAYQAPHDPLQVPESWLRRYKGKFDIGWDQLRRNRLARQKRMGLVDPGARLADRLWFVPAWDDLLPAAQVQSSRRMEIYAAMVEYMDGQIGRLLKYLEDTGQLDNTIVVFFSDNGPEGNDPIANAKRRTALDASAWYPNNYNLDYQAYGRSYSYMAYGAPWAQVSATPFSGYKGSVYEGGIRSPLVIWHPKLRQRNINRSAILHITDLAPTLMDLAGGSARGMQGRSWMPLINGRTSNPRSDGAVVAGQFFGARMARSGSWKAVWMPEPYGYERWELFNVVKDPGETRDLSAAQPGVRSRLIAAYQAYERSNNVIRPNRTPYDGLEDLLPPRPPVHAEGWPRGAEPNYTSE